MKQATEAQAKTYTELISQIVKLDGMIDAEMRIGGTTNILRLQSKQNILREALTELQKEILQHG